MTQKYVYSTEKFKEYYRKRLVIINILFVLNMLEFFIVIYTPGLLRSVTKPIDVILILGPSSVTTIIWLCTWSWYYTRLVQLRCSYVILRNDYLIYKFLKTPRGGYSYSWAKDYIYKVRNISKIELKGHFIIIYGDVVMNQKSTPPAYEPGERYYSHIKIPNVFKDIENLSNLAWKDKNKKGI